MFPFELPRLDFDRFLERRVEVGFAALFEASSFESFARSAASSFLFFFNEARGRPLDLVFGFKEEICEHKEASSFCRDAVLALT